MTYSQNLSPEDPVEVKIDQTYFDVSGVLEVHGSVNGQPIELTICPDDRLFSELLPKGVTIEQVTNHEGMYIGRLDNYQNLHWQVKTNGQVRSRTVPLTKLLEQRLYEKFINQ